MRVRSTTPFMGLWMLNPFQIKAVWTPEVPRMEMVLSPVPFDFKVRGVFWEMISERSARGFWFRMVESRVMVWDVGEKWSILGAVICRVFRGMVSFWAIRLAYENRKIVKHLIIFAHYSRSERRSELHFALIYLGIFNLCIVCLSHRRHLFFGHGKRARSF